MPKYAAGIASALAVCSICSPFLLMAQNQDRAATELVRNAVQNEIAANQHNPGMHFMFKDEKKTAQYSQTKLMVETQEATAGLLIMQNGQPLSSEERKDEDARLAGYMQNSQELRRKKKQEKEDAEHTERILRALPDAFIYQRDGTQQGREGLGAPGDQLVQLNFRPNPSYSPPSHVEQVLTGMRGHLLIDTTQQRIAEIDGTLVKEVEFGWGIFGHLDPAGRFFVQQADVGDHQWEVTHMELYFTGKMLLFKKFTVHSNDTFSEFHPVPGNLTFAQGVALLKKAAAGNQSAEKPAGDQQNRAETAQNRRAASGQNISTTLCCDR